MMRHTRPAVALGGLYFTIVVSFCLAFGMNASIGQEDAPTPESDQTAPIEESADILDRETPRRSMIGFLAALEKGDFERAAEFMDLRNLPRKAKAVGGPELARKFKIFLDRALWIDPDELSDSPEGAAGDGLPSYRDSFGRVEVDGEDVALLMQRVPAGNDVFVWKISNATAALIPTLREQVDYGPIGELIRDLVPPGVFLGVELFKWVSGLVVAAVAAPIYYLIGWALARLFSRPDSPVYPRVRYFFTRPVVFLATALTFGGVVISLGVGTSQTAQTLIRAGTLTTVLGTWVILSAVTMVREIQADRLRRRGRESGIVLLAPISNALKLIVIVLAILMWLDNVGFDITTLLAGLGVGGIAVALVLQKPLEDIFGAITLYSQQPIKVGDFCRFGQTSGTVEEIGLRATRVRTLGNTVITLPNAKLASEYIENLSARRKVLYQPVLKLRYDTTPDQLQEVLEQVRNLLDTHEKVISEDARVRFAGFTDHSFDLQLFAYIGTTKWAEYLEIAEDLNMRIMLIVQKAGTAFALPAQNLIMEGGAGAAEKTGQAETLLGRKSS